MKTENIVLSGTPADLQVIVTFCREAFHRTYGTKEGEQRVRKLAVIDALILWHNWQLCVPFQPLNFPKVYA